jgi:hypothetical protein
MKRRVLNNRPLEPEFGEPYPHYRVYSKRSFAIVRVFGRACGVLAIIIFISAAVALYRVGNREPDAAWGVVAAFTLLMLFFVARHRCGRLLAADESTWRTALQFLRAPVLPAFLGLLSTFSNNAREVADRPKRQS